MKEKPLTIKECVDEIERLLRIWLYQKCSPQEEKTFKQLIKNALDRKGWIEHEKLQAKEEERARRERNKYGAER